MLSDFRAESDIHGERINLSWTWTGPGSWPGMRLVRARRAYPGKVDDGLTVVDLADLFGMLTASVLRVERNFCLPRNTEVESRLQMAEVALYFADSGAAQPHRALICYYDTAAAEYNSVALDEVSRIDRTEASAASWGDVQTLEIFVTPGGGAEVPAGRVVIFTAHEDGITPDRFEWIATGADPVAVEFDHIRQQNITVVLDEIFDPNSGDWKRCINVQDNGLEPELVYYYRLYVEVPVGSGTYRSEREWCAAVMATGRYGISERMYQLLPNVHQYYDEPAPAQRGRGLLRRFLEIFGAVLDQTRGLAEGLRTRHDVHEAHVDTLPYLARWIGWDPDLTADARLLRTDILQAPEIFSSVGTISNLRAVVNRVTGWDCKIKEFVHNVFLTNAPETIRLWEIWGRTYDGTDWSDPAPVTRTEGFDGRPVLVGHDGSPWLIFHSNRTGRRDLWLKRHDIAMATPYQAVLHTDGGPRPVPINEYPVAGSDGTQLWLFWDSNRDGHWDVWGSWDTGDSPFEDPPKGPAANLTEHEAEDRHPATVYDGTHIWLFWQSNRRGPTDIWAQQYDNMSGWESPSDWESPPDWKSPRRVSTAQFRHERPAAVIDGDSRLWLFFIDDLGDRRNLVVQIHQGDVWSVPVSITDGAWRDEAPHAVFWNGQIWLFWHSNRHGHWQILGQVWEWDGGEGPPVAVGSPFGVTTDITGDKEPAAFVDTSNHLRVVWRSQRRGRDYQSRTIDTGDAEMLARLGTFEDRAHYSYDTRTTDNEWYARDTIGIFLTPETEQQDVVDRGRRLIQGPLRQFLPIHVRPVLFILPAVYKEYVYTYDFLEVEPQRKIEDSFERETTAVTTEVYSGLNDNYTDMVPEWIWLRSWSVDYTNHRTMDFTVIPIATNYRTWHIGVQPGG